MRMTTYIHTKTCTWMFMEVLFIRVKRLKQSKCLLTNEWMYKCDLFIHRVEYYSAMEKNAELIHDKT